MGASTSAEPRVSAEQKEAEAVAASTGALPMLQKAFSKLANPETNAVPSENLKRCFSFSRSYCGSTVSDSFPVLLDHLGSSLVDQFFVIDKEGINWVEFVTGYNKCCGRVSASVSLNMLMRIFVAISETASVPLHLEFESGDAVTDCKINGHLLPSDVFLLLSLCWVMSWGSRNLNGEGNLSLPDLNHLVLSVIMSCGQIEGGLNVWGDCDDVSSMEVQLPAGKFVTWVMSTVPCLPDCLGQYFHARLQMAATDGVELASSNSSVGNTLLISAYDYILTQGRAWAISITQKSKVNEEISRALISNAIGMDDDLVYRSSTHGRGLGRFWSHVEGYKGPLLVMIAASSGNAHEENYIDRKWIIGALTDQGFENKNIFYGNSGCLYSIGPVFHVFPPTGKERNYVYSHLHPTSKVYQPHPKPVGVAFGGTPGNERIFIDEDFAKVTLRHHAVDKTYRSGSLFPDQGFLPVEGLISEVEVWGLGGKAAKGLQNSYKKREELFTEQRRKVDLKTFASWEDSPEKMMMDMMSDPNAVRREDR